MSIFQFLSFSINPCTHLSLLGLILSLWDTFLRNPSSWTFIDTLVSHASDALSQSVCVVCDASCGAARHEVWCSRLSPAD